MSKSEYQEPFRPQYHFSPPAGWMNDPNGLVYYAGDYHLFYQYTPNNMETFDPKSWGHAVSRDLLHWENLPVALKPDSIGSIFSGSAVVDWHNSSGFQKGEEPPLVAIFTHAADNGEQAQSLAFSNDRGRNWTKFTGNPVIRAPKEKDFRDPKVFFHTESGVWVLVLAAGDRVKFYTSANLIDWHYASDFGEFTSSHEGVWECPDLFELPVDNNPARKKWVLLVSVGEGAPNGGSGTRYFVGDFDGVRFRNERPANTVNWVDYGPDNYAGVTFSDMPETDGRRIFIGWMSNWAYAFSLPTHPWKGVMTLPRELKLVSLPDGSLNLVSTPVAEVETLRRKGRSIQSRPVQPALNFELSLTMPYPEAPGGFEIITTIELGASKHCGLILSDQAGQTVSIAYDAQKELLCIDRRASGVVEFDPAFARDTITAPLRLHDGTISLQLFIDHASIEVFAQDGETVLSCQVFPEERYSKLSIYTIDAPIYLTELQVYPLESIWKT